MKRLVAAMLLIMLLCQALPVEALAGTGLELSRDEIARARALTGLGSGDAQDNGPAYHAGMKLNAGWNAKQLRGWLDEKLDRELDSICDTFTQAFFTLSEMETTHPENYRLYAGSAEFGSAKALSLQAEGLREELRFYRDQLEEASGVIAEMSRWLVEERSAIFDSDAVRYSARIAEAEREIREIRNFIMDKADDWSDQISRLRQYQQSGSSTMLGESAVGTWLTGLLQEDDAPVSTTVPITRVNAAASRVNRLKQASGLVGDVEARITVYTDNEVVISLAAEQDGKLIPVNGAVVSARDALNPYSDWQTYPYENGTVMIPINRLTADEYDLFHIEAKIDPTAQGYRDIYYEDLDLERGELYTCMLTPLDSPANDIGASKAYPYMMSFNGKDIMQSEYKMIYSAANDYKFEIRVGIRNSSGGENTKLTMVYYENNGPRKSLKRCEVEPTSRNGDVYTFRGPWKQLFSPYASKEQRPAFELSENGSKTVFVSQLVSIKSATDTPINEGTGAEGGVFANVLGKGFTGAFKIPVIDVNFKLNLPLTSYLPRLSINPGGYVVIYVGSDMFQDVINSYSRTNWQSKDLKEFKNAQKYVEKEGFKANYEAQWNLAKDFYREKKFKCLGDYSIQLGWFVVATGRWELDNSVEDVLSRNISLRFGTGFTVSASANWTFVPIPPAPLFYVTVSLGLSASVSVDFTLDLCWVNGEFRDWDLRPIDNFSVDIGFLFALQAGIGVKGFLEGFARGAFSADAVFTVSPHHPASILVKMSVDVTFGVTFFVATFTKALHIGDTQLYPPKNAANLLAHYMGADSNEDYKDLEPAYGEPFNYPALTTDAVECFPYASQKEGKNYKVVSVNGKMFAFSIYQADGADGKLHSRVGWECLENPGRHTLQELLNDEDIRSQHRTWADAVNEREDYDFDVCTDGRFVYVIATCAKDYDSDGYPVPDDWTVDPFERADIVRNMIAYMTVLEADAGGGLNHHLSVTEKDGHNFVFGAASVQGTYTSFQTLSYDSITRPRIAIARPIWQNPEKTVFDHFEVYGEMARIAYPNGASSAGASGFIYQGEKKFRFLTDKMVQSSMGDGYERETVTTFDASDNVDYTRSKEGYSLSFVALSRPKDNAAGDSVIELFNWNMNNLFNHAARKAVALEKGDIENLVLVRDRENGDRAGIMLFYTKAEVNGDGAKQHRLHGLRISPTSGAGTDDFTFNVTRYDYDVAIPANRFETCYIGPVPYLSWVSLATKRNETDPDIWQVWIMACDMATNTISDPSVFAEFRLPQITFGIEDASGESHPYAFDAALSNAMLTDTGTGFLNAVPVNMETVPEEIRPAYFPTSLLSFTERMTPSAILTAAIPKELAVKAGSFDDMAMGLMNDGNLGITAFDIAMYDATEGGNMKLVETAHFDALHPENSSVTMADGKVVRTGKDAVYRTEDYNNTSRKRDWVLDHETVAYHVQLDHAKTSVTGGVIEPSDPRHIMTDLLMPGSAGGYTAAFKIPDDWAAGSHTLQMKVSALYVNANWTRAMALAAGAQANGLTGNGAGENVELKYVLNEKTGRLELQKPANAAGLLADALGSGLYAAAIDSASVPVTVEVHDLEVSHRVYRGLGGERWVDIIIRNHAATREGMKLVCAVYVDGSEEPEYINLPYYENAALSHKTQTITLPVSALVDDPDVHRTARVEILSVDRKERAYANNEFTLYFDGSDPLRFVKQPEDVNIQEGENATFSVEAAGGVESYTYQWQAYTPGAEKWEELSDLTEATITREKIRKNSNGARFRCIVTDALGTKIVSREAVLTVRKNVHTGDSSNLPLYLTVAFAALALLWLLHRRDRLNQRG